MSSTRAPASAAAATTTAATAAAATTTAAVATVATSVAAVATAAVATPAVATTREWGDACGGVVGGYGTHRPDPAASSGPFGPHLHTHQHHYHRDRNRGGSQEQPEGRVIHDQTLRRFPPTAYSENVRRWRTDPIERANAAVADLQLPSAVFKTCPWHPRDLIETGLRQWLRCCAPALRDDQVIGMPSRAVDEAWHGLILCTARYAQFCRAAYGEFLHHHPDGGAPDDAPAATDPPIVQRDRTVVAWSLVAMPGEQCVLWDLDYRVGVEQPWAVDLGRVARIRAAVERLTAGRRP